MSRAAELVALSKPVGLDNEIFAYGEYVMVLRAFGNIDDKAKSHRMRGTKDDVGEKSMCLSAYLASGPRYIGLIKVLI